MGLLDKSKRLRGKGKKVIRKKQKKVIRKKQEKVIGKKEKTVPDKKKSFVKPVMSAAEPFVNLVTNVDRVYQVVLEKKSVSLNDLAMRFSVSLGKVEEWAKVLDETGLLELHYPVIGKAELRVKAEKMKKQIKLDKKTKLIAFAVFLLIAIAAGVFLIVKIFYVG